MPALSAPPPSVRSTARGSARGPRKAAKPTAKKDKKAVADKLRKTLAPPLKLTHPALLPIADNLACTPLTTRRVTFRSPIAARSPAAPVDLPPPPAAAKLGPAAASLAVSPEEVAADAKRRERPASLSPVNMEQIPSPPPSRPAGVVARNAMLADSLGARMAARRRERQTERTRSAAEAGGILAGGGSKAAAAAGAPTSTSHVTSELERIRHEREHRVQKLFAQLDKLSQTFQKAISPSKGGKGGSRPAKEEEASQADGGAAGAPGGGASDGATTALVPYRGTGLLHDDYQTTVLLNLLRGKDSRKWLNAWLREDPSRVEKVRQVVADAPGPLQAVLASVLGRRLEEVSEELSAEHEREVRITLLGGKALLEPSQQRAAAAAGKRDERPLPRPLPRATAPLLLLGYNPTLDHTDSAGRSSSSGIAAAAPRRAPTPPPPMHDAAAAVPLASARVGRRAPTLVSVPEDSSLAAASPPRIEELIEAVSPLDVEQWEAREGGAFVQSHRDVPTGGA